MKFRIGAMLLVMLGMSQFAFAANERQFQWPGKIRAAVSLSYDDALNSHLDQVIPALDKYRLKGSFYLTLSNPSVATRMSEWRAAAQRGHELGNHTLFHQCSAALPGREWVQPKNDLDRTSADQLKDQILLANTMLHAIDGKRERTFTVPCGDQQAGGVNYVEMLKSDFVAIKARAGSGVTADMMALDPFGRIPLSTS
ncbi:MAG: polysaccharide deacetylase [Paucimonas sp.]|nr:polysaccharide deacetylase [Paucimonas sp.]